MEFQKGNLPILDCVEVAALIRIGGQHHRVDKLHIEACNSTI